VSNQFVEAAMEVGFTQEQAEFMDELLAKYPHSHRVEEVEGLDDYIETAIEDNDDDDEEG
jgi:hypothetical protein